MLVLTPLTPGDLLFHLGQLVVLIVAVATMTANYLTCDRNARRKIHWLLAGALILLLGRIAILAGTYFFDLLHVPDLTLGAAQTVISAAGILRLFTWTVATLGMIVCVLFAIFYRGAIDPEMVIRRTAIYSAGFGLLLFTFGVFVNYVADIVVEVLDLRARLV
jgi:hypothetical protein